MIRLKAALIHLGICLVIALLFSALIFGVWYPAPLGRATDVFHIFWIVLAVDITIGPLITLIIYNPKKKELKWDLLIIAILQLTALIYGTYTVYSSRPVYLVFNIDRFELIQAKELTSEKLAKVTNHQFKKNPILRYEVIAAQLPADSNERTEMMFSALNGGDDLPYLPQYYTEYQNELPKVKSSIKPLLQLNEFNPEKQSFLMELQKRYANKKVGFLPIKAPYQDLTAVVDEETGEVEEIVDVLPWQVMPVVKGK